MTVFLSIQRSVFLFLEGLLTHVFADESQSFPEIKRMSSIINEFT